MAATYEGNQKVNRKALMRFGGCEYYDNCGKCRVARRKYREYMAEIGARGGKKRVPKGWSYFWRNLKSGKKQEA